MLYAQCEFLPYDYSHLLGIKMCGMPLRCECLSGANWGVILFGNAWNHCLNNSQPFSLIESFCNSLFCLFLFALLLYRSKCQYCIYLHTVDKAYLIWKYCKLTNCDFSCFWMMVFDNLIYGTLLWTSWHGYYALCFSLLTSFCYRIEPVMVYCTLNDFLFCMKYWPSSADYGLLIMHGHFLNVVFVLWIIYFECVCIYILL